MAFADAAQTDEVLRALANITAHTSHDEEGELASRGNHEKEAGQAIITHLREAEGLTMTIPQLNVSLNWKELRRPRRPGGEKLDCITDFWWYRRDLFKLVQGTPDEVRLVLDGTEDSTHVESAPTPPSPAASVPAPCRPVGERRQEGASGAPASARPTPGNRMSEEVESEPDATYHNLFEQDFADIPTYVPEEREDPEPEDPDDWTDVDTDDEEVDEADGRTEWEDEQYGSGTERW